MSGGKQYGLYIHIPFCRAKCVYCAFVSTPDMSLCRDYVDALVREITECGGGRLAADTVYIGGGTPSCLFRGGIDRILAAVRAAFVLAPDAEITVEANPESCTADFVRECTGAGVNRISMGLQCANDEVLKAIGRVHTYGDFIAACDRLLKGGIDNISSDVMLGLPGQTAADVRNSVEAIAERCAHCSVYALTVEEGTRLYDSGYVPDDDTVADMYDEARALLAKHGFLRYEVSNFAKPGRESRHNLKYWSCEPYIGFGTAAHGYDGARTRFRHTDSISGYIAGEPQQTDTLTDADLYNEYVMLRLRTERGIDRKAFRARFGTDIYDFACGLIARLERDGSIIADGDSVRIAPERMFVMNGIIEEFMIDK